MKITFLGHSGFLLAGSKRICIDPFFTGNPVAKQTPGDINRLDLMLVTHDHGDHMGDAVAICKHTEATLFASHEIATDAADRRGLKAEGFNVGGTMNFEGVKVHMVHAQHSSATGNQCGFVVEMDGKVIYHLGDTGLFGDMKLIAEMLKPEVALVPIGDRYTMGPPSAARAVELIKPKIVIPMHFNTFPIIEQNPEVFASLVGDTAEVRVLAPGASTEV